MNGFNKGDRVSHSRFGPGVVGEVNARYTIIEFDEAGVRKFVTALVQLERSESPIPVELPPPRRPRGRRQSAAPEQKPRSGITEPEAKATARRNRPGREGPT
jgi:hypothetical protein